MSTWKQQGNIISIAFKNNVELEVMLNPANGAHGTCEARGACEVRGIGEVKVGGVPLRNSSTLLYPWLRSVKGMEYVSFKLNKVEEKDGGVVISTTACGLPRHEEAYGDQYNDHQFFLSQKLAPVEDSFDWIIKPESLLLDGVAYEGFSYAFKFESKTEKLHRIVAVGTWEIGGSATGNTILSLGQVTPAVYTAEKDTHFTSACLISLRDFGKPLGMSFQWQPRLGVQQHFDFLASSQGSLLGGWVDKADVRSFTQKNPDEDVFFFADADHFQASQKAATTPKLILFAPAGKSGLPEHEQRNRWKSAFDYFGEAARNWFGIKTSRPLPERTIPYGSKLEKDGTFWFQVGERWVKSQEWLIAIADDILPNLAKQGVKRVMTEPVSESDPTQRGLECKLHSGIHGDLNVGSCCCTHKFTPAEFFGGMKAWKYYADKAHALGLEVGIWVAPHLSANSAIMKEHPDWAIKSFTSLGYSGGYPNFELASVNLNTPVLQWMLDDIKHWRDEGGIDYVWIDSLSNLGMLPLDYSKEMQPNTYGVAEFIAGLQRIGIRNIAIEGMSCLGMSGAGLMDVDPATTGGVAWIAGQNCWEWYENNEDMICDQQPRTWIHKTRTEDNVRGRFFRCLANHCIPELTRYTPAAGNGVAWYKNYAENYLAVEGLLEKRTILPDKRGVLWSKGKEKALFAFKDFSLELPGLKSAEIVENGKATPCTAGAKLEAKAWQVYKLKLT